MTGRDQMRFRIPLVVGLALIALLSTSEATNFIGGNELVTWWRSYQVVNHPTFTQGDEITSSMLQDIWQSGMFESYVLGVFDATWTLYNAPLNSSRKQMYAIVGKYLDGHPERWSEPARDLVSAALQEAFAHPSK